MAEVNGEIPVVVTGDATSGPAVVVVPSIFGAHDDLVAQMASLSDVGPAVVLDPFWRIGGGDGPTNTVPYGDAERAIGRLDGFERSRCRDDVAAVADWTKDRFGGPLVGVGICFGGPWVLIGAAKGWFDGGAVTWHGSRLETTLDLLDGLTAPLRLHFGDADPITPPEAIDAVRSHFAAHDDCEIVVHPGANHGFSHEGAAWDPAAAAAGLASVRELLTRPR